jgi:hypothetical protein
MKKKNSIKERGMEGKRESAIRYCYAAEIVNLMDCLCGVGIFSAILEW